MTESDYEITISVTQWPEGISLDGVQWEVFCPNYLAFVQGNEYDGPDALCRKFRAEVEYMKLPEDLLSRLEGEIRGAAYRMCPRKALGMIPPLWMRK